MEDERFANIKVVTKTRTKLFILKNDLKLNLLPKRVTALIPCPYNNSSKLINVNDNIIFSGKMF